MILALLLAFLVIGSTAGKVVVINYKAACWNYMSCILTNLDNLDSFTNVIPSNHTSQKKFYQTKLYFRHSNMTWLPKRIDDVFPNVHGVYINDCGVRFLNSDSFLDMQALIEISLKNNRISELSDDVFPARQFSNVRDLDLSHNEIRYVHWNAFGGVPYLEILHLDHNRIKEVSRNMFRLPELQEIYLNDNLIDKIPIGLFKNNLQLKLVNLQRNRIVNIERFTESNNVNVLRHLDISDNPLGSVRDLNQNFLWNMADLIYLNLSSTSLKVLANTSFSDLKEIQQIDISNNYLKFINIYDFRLLKHLKLLYLHNNKLTNFEFDMFLEFGIDLHFVTLHNNNWTCSNLLSIVQYVKENQIEVINWPNDIQTLCDMWKSCSNEFDEV